MTVNAAELLAAPEDSGRAHTTGFTTHEPLADVVRAFIDHDLEAARRERGL